jgi:hypothetical protein
VPRGTLVPGPRLSTFMYGTFTLFGGPFQCPSITLLAAFCRVLNPADRGRRFGLLRFRSPLLAESFLFLRILRCFSSPGSLRLAMCSPAGASLFAGGFPHSDISGSSPAHGSPLLFAVCHVLLRLLTPRHPPFAFCCLACHAETALDLAPARIAFVQDSFASVCSLACSNRPSICLSTDRSTRFLLFCCQGSPAILLLWIAGQFVKQTARQPDARRPVGGNCFWQLLGSFCFAETSIFAPMGLTRLELVTFPLSEGCSNRLSYRPGQLLSAVV